MIERQFFGIMIFIVAAFACGFALLAVPWGLARDLILLTSLAAGLVVLARVHQPNEA